MQIIQSIKDRGGIVMAILIAIALISFILMDSNTSANRGKTGDDAIGKINGNSIDYSEFDKRVKIAEAKQAGQKGGQPLTSAESNQVREQVWNQIVAENVFYKEAEKLGITLTSKELTAVLNSNDQSNPLTQERSLMGADGKLDPAKVKEALENIKKATGEQRDNIDAELIESIKLNSAAAKYGAMMNASAYYPTWMKEKEMAEDKSFATISYITVPYSDISDSTIAVTDADVNAYVSKHKKLFKQEAGRSISYVSFSQNPSAADSVEARKLIENIKIQFASDSSPKTFAARNSSSIAYQDDFIPLARIQSTVKDSMVKYGEGTIAGPFLDGNNYTLSKILGTKQLPDSVKARHILLGTRTREGALIMEDSAASKLADSVLAAIKGGASFKELAAKYSSDEGSKIKGGELATFGNGAMVPEFNEFCFNKSVGSTEKVKTQFGYHIINIVNQSNFKPAYKIVIVAKPILPSNETINGANMAATKAAANKSTKDLKDYITKNPALKLEESPMAIKEIDNNVGALQDARLLVKWAFDAKVGAVSDPIPVGKSFVVATLNKIYAEGTQDAATAKSGAESIIKKEKKAAMIIAKLGATPTLETAASAYNKQIQNAGADSSISMTSKLINGLGVEPKIIGAAFNSAYLTKASPAIEGTTGVFVIKTNAVQPRAATTAEQEATFIKTKEGTLKQVSANWFEALRKQAEIKDNRAKFF
jgi:peptidyl-prolyl cis-trans isomerase D